MNFDNINNNKDFIDSLKYLSDILIKLTEKIYDQDKQIDMLTKDIKNINDILLDYKNQQNSIKNIIKNYKNKNYNKSNDMETINVPETNIITNNIPETNPTKNTLEKNKIDKLINSIISKKNELNNINLNNEKIYTPPENYIIKEEEQNYIKKPINTELSGLKNTRKKLNSIRRF